MKTGLSVLQNQKLPWQAERQERGIAHKLQGKEKQGSSQNVKGDKEDF